jgi:gliding motility associated protien GldN
MKKIKRKVLIISIYFLLPLFSMAQVLEPLQEQPEDITNGAYKKVHNQEKEEAYHYPEIKEKDIVWSRTIWREIDLKQKINHHFYFPAIENKANLNPEKMSLIDVIMESLQDTVSESFRCFKIVNNAPPGNEFKYGQLTNFEKMRLGASVQKGEAIQSEWGGGDSILNGITQYYSDIVTPFNRTEVLRWNVKEEWFFDKHRSKMSARIIGLCPIRTYIDENDEERDMPLFWIYFPDFRDVLVQTKVANFTKNNAQQRSYLGIFEKRMFGSRILQESNIMNRQVTDYMIGLDALLESERIKEEIFNIEHDMWEY